MGWVRRAGILLVVALLALSLAGAIAGAKKKHKKKGHKWGSHVTLAHPSSTTTGKVTSKLKACGGSRVVTLFYTDPNNGQISPLSVQRTNGKGHYQVTLTTPAYTGTYHAQVSKRKIRAMKAPQTCKATESATIGV